MRSSEADQVLRTMLLEGGVDLDQPTVKDVTRAWEVFQQFAAIPAEDIAEGPESDGVLAQHGVGDWGDDDGRHFYLDLTRQFGESGGESLSQLSCALIFDASPELEQLQSSSLWSFDLEPDEFWSRANQLPGVEQVLALEAQPRRLRIEFGQL